MCLLDDLRALMDNPSGSLSGPSLTDAGAQPDLLPEDVEWLSDTNIVDRTIPEGLAEALVKDNRYTTHDPANPSGDWFGEVWFEGGLFREQVWFAHQPKADFTGDTLEKVITRSMDFIEGKAN